MGGYYGDNYYGNEWHGQDYFGTAYLKSLSTLVAKKGASKVMGSFESLNPSAAIADEESPKRDVSTSYDVPISDFIRPNRTPGKTRLLEKNKVRYGTEQHCSDPLCHCDVPSRIDLEVVRPDLTPALAPNRINVGVRPDLTPAFAPNRINVGMAIPAMPNHADIGHEALERQLSPAWSRHHDHVMQGQFLEPEDDTGNWTLVESSRRGGTASSLTTPPSARTKNCGSKMPCSCPERCNEYFCKSSKCRNDQRRDRPAGSVTTGRVGTEEGSPKSTLPTTRYEAPLQPKPSDHDGSPQMGHVRLARNTATVLKHLEETLAKSGESTNADILNAPS